MSDNDCPATIGHRHGTVHCREDLDDDHGPQHVGHCGDDECWGSPIHWDVKS